MAFDDWVEKRLTLATALIIVPPRLPWAVNEGRRRLDDEVSIPDFEPRSVLSPVSSDLGGGWSVPSGDVPDSRSPAILEEFMAEDPPREPGTHDPRHQAGSEEPAVH